MTSKPHMQAGSTGTSTITRTGNPSDDNLLKDLIPYLDLSQLSGIETNCCSPDTASPNDNLCTSELPQTQDSNSEIVNKMVSTKHDTVSDVQATQKMADYSHNSSSLCSSSPVTVQLTQDFCWTKAEALWDEKRTYGIKETDSGSTAGSVQVLISDCNIKMSCNAEINAKENQSNNTHKISNNNKENNVVNSTDNVNKHKELLDLATESAQQTATNVLEKPWEREEMFIDEDKINSIWAVDSGCISGDVQALNTSEDKIPMSWNADINSEENKSNSKQNVSNTTNGNYAGNSKDMVNSTEKLSDAEIGASQHSGKDVLGTPHKTGLSCFCNSRENNFIAPEDMSPKDGLQCPDFPVTILGSDTICPPANMPSTPSASNKSTEPLTEAETPTTCTSRVTSKCSSITKSTGVHHTVAQISAAKNSSEEQEETKSTARKINYANTGTKKSEKQSSAEIYSGIPSNIPTKFLQCGGKFSQTVSTIVPKSYSKGQTSATLPLTPEQIYNKIMEKHYPRVVEKHLFSSPKNACVQLHTQKCTPVILLHPNQNPEKSNAKKCKKQSPVRKVKTPTKMHIEIYPKFRVIPRNSDAGTKIPSAKAVHGNGNKSATTTKLNDKHTIKMLEMPQPSSVNTVPNHGIVRRRMLSIVQSLPTILTASKRDSTAKIIMTTSARNLCAPVKISNTPTFSTASKGLLTTSATSNVTNPSNTSSSVAWDHTTKSQLPTAPQSNSTNLPAHYSCVYTADVGHDTLQQGTELTKQLEYQPIPNNTVNSTPTKTIHLKKGTPRISNSCWSTLRAKHPKLKFSETSPSQTVQDSNQQQDTDNREIHTVTSIDDDAAKYAGRDMVIICGRDRGKKSARTYKVGANFGNRRSAKTMYEMHRFPQTDTHLLDTASHEDGNSQRGGGSKLQDSMLCRSKVRNSSITEQSTRTKRKYTKSKITKNDQLDDGKIKKRAYARKTRHVHNNSKSTSPPPYSTRTDASCSIECQKRVTRKAQRIAHQNIPGICDNHLSCKNNKKSARMSGKQMQTSKASRETFTSASPYEPVIKHMKHSYKPSDSNSPIIMDDISSDNISTQYNTVITPSNFQNNERQIGSQSQYSAPLIRKHEHNFTMSDNIHHNIYMGNQQEQMSQIQHNEKYFTNSQNLAELYTGMYVEGDTWGDITTFKSNQEFPMIEVERHAGQQLTEYEHNFTKLADDIYHLYGANDQELTWQFQYNNQYFPSSQNAEELLHTDMHKNVGTWGDTFKFNRNNELPRENVGRHIQQPNDYETSIIQNGNQNVMNKTEPNSYGYQSECNRTKLNDEDFQWYEAHNHMDACNSINNYCKINLPTQTENFSNCQPSSKIGYGHQSQYDQAFSAERNSEEVQQPTFTSNEDIHHEQIITNQKYTNVLPTTEMFQEEAWQELDFYTNHKHTGVEQTYFNNGENIAQNWEAQTSNDPLTTYNNQMLIPINSNSLTMIEAECLKPQLKPTNNFRESKDAQLSDYTKIMLEASKKKYAGNKRISTTQTVQRQAKPYKCSLCGERAQYKVLLQRHLDLHHGHTSENLFSHNK